MRALQVGLNVLEKENLKPKQSLNQRGKAEPVSLAVARRPRSAPYCSTPAPLTDAPTATTALPQWWNVPPVAVNLKQKLNPNPRVKLAAEAAVPRVLLATLDQVVIRRVSTLRLAV